MRVRRLYYGWYDQKTQTFRVSLMPPDAPVRPSIPFEGRMEIVEMVRKRRADILWSPPLTKEQESLSP